MMLALLASPKVQHRDNELLSACTHTYIQGGRTTSPTSLSFMIINLSLLDGEI
jgi:hypothetical protein